jgi:asparagine synthase (glutamine-hydrolysing)
MCGIAGIFDFAGGPIATDRLTAMADVQSHRGPDGHGLVLFRIRRGDFALECAPREGDEPFNGGLAHRRLAIIDLSERGHQPMHDGTERLWVSFNGEIYNYVELMQQLEARGHRFRSRSDTEVILHAYREWGDACVEHFNGMFAFALWDADARRLMCARDRLGIKPFYYRLDGQRIAFASEIKALLVAEEAGPRANVPAIGDYLCYSFVPSTETLFEGIWKLPPGHRLVATNGECTVESYWNPAFGAEPATSDDDLIDELRTLLRDSVRLQLRSDVPIGAHLSGGIDSSIVCTLAAGGVDRLRTFNARFAEGGLFDESPYARLVADAIHSEHHEIVPSGGDIRELLPKVIYHLDEPTEGSAVFGKYHVAQIVASNVKVVLGGQGGDELFGGYDWYVKALFTAACYGSSIDLGADRRRIQFLRNCFEQESRPRLARSLASNFGQRDVARIFARNWRRIAPGGERAIIRRDLFGSAPTSDERFRAAFDALPDGHPADRMFHFDMRYYLEALLQSEDRLSMAFSVESRVPLLDHRIAELAARAGFARKTVPGNSKALLRAAVDGIAPPQILARRDKRGFPTPIDKWLRDPRLALVDQFVLGSPFAKQLFDLDRVRALARRRITFGSSWSETLWRAVTLSTWGDRFRVGV